MRCHGLLGTYDDGLAWLKKTANLGRPKCILWMGSSIGNLDRTGAAEFLKGFSGVLRNQDAMLIGIDACQESEKVYRAYNDKQGTTHEFVLNGLKHANKLMGKEVFRRDDWKVIGEYDEIAGRHQAFYSPVEDVMVEGTPIMAGEKIRIEESYKYSLVQSNELWQRAGLMVRARFGNRTNEYRKLTPCYAVPSLAFPALHKFESIVLMIREVPKVRYLIYPTYVRPMALATALDLGPYYIIIGTFMLYDLTIWELRKSKYQNLYSANQHVGRLALGLQTGRFLSFESR